MAVGQVFSGSYQPDYDANFVGWFFVTLYFKLCSKGKGHYNELIVVLCFAVKQFEHLDWAARMRIVMGVAYCLQYMHHDLNPPIPHPNLTSNNVYLTDDYAAKVYLAPSFYLSSLSTCMEV